MPPPIQPATPVRLASIVERPSEYVGKKVRVAGRTLISDLETSTILLADQDYAIQVDASLPMASPDTQDDVWFRVPKSLVMIIGYLEQLEERLLLPQFPIPSLKPCCQLDAHFRLQAVLVVEARDLDLSLWNSTITEREEAGLIA